MHENPALQLAAAAAVAFGMTACATTPPPRAELAAARAMVSQAAPMAAQEAPLEFNLAKGKLARAEEAMNGGEYGTARIYAEQAEIDARYAWTLAENTRAQRAAEELERNIRTLRDELERGSK